MSNKRKTLGRMFLDMISDTYGRMKEHPTFQHCDEFVIVIHPELAKAIGITTEIVLLDGQNEISMMVDTSADVEYTPVVELEYDSTTDGDGYTTDVWILSKEEWLKGKEDA